MSLPLLNRKLVLQTPKRSPDHAGGYATDWQPLGELWGEVRSGTGSERGANALALSRVPLRITVRAAQVGSDARPRAGQRFLEGARVYSITAVTERDTQGRFLTCHAEEEVAT